MHPTLRSRMGKVFGVQLYKNNACALLLRILSIVNPDWLQHVRSVRIVCEAVLNAYTFSAIYSGPPKCFAHI